MRLNKQAIHLLFSPILFQGEKSGNAGMAMYLIQERPKNLRFAGA